MDGRGRERAVDLYAYAPDGDSACCGGAWDCGSGRELGPLNQRGGGRALGELGSVSQVVCQILVDDHEVEAAGRSINRLCGDVEAIQSELFGVERSLAGERKEEDSAVLGTDGEHRALGVGDGGVAGTISAAAEVRAYGASLGAIEEIVDDPAGGRIGAADKVVEGVARGHAPGDTDGPGFHEGCNGVDVAGSDLPGGPADAGQRFSASCLGGAGIFIGAILLSSLG